jgi:hypothetical protein
MEEGFFLVADVSEAGSVGAAVANTIHDQTKSNHLSH